MINSEKILIVEDDPDSLALITELLSEAGLITYTANNNQDAIRLAKEILPDLVLLDQDLPALKGKELWDTIRALDENASFIYLVSADTAEEFISHNSSECGVADFLVKPISKELLRARVNALLRLRKLEADRRANEERVKEIWEQLPVGFQSLDTNRRLTNVNGAWVTMLGYQKGEVIGKVFEDFILPGSLDAFRYWFDQVRTGQKDQKTELELLGKDGLIKHVSLAHINGSNADSEYSQIDCTLTNIPEPTELSQPKISQLEDSSRYREALDQVASFIFMKDKDHRYIYANKMIQKLFNSTAEEIIGKRDDDFFPKDSARRLLEIDDQVLTGKQVQEEVSLTNPDGTEKNYWEVKTPIYKGTGQEEVIGLLGISTDITEKKKLIAESQSIRARLEAAMLAMTDGVLITDHKGKPLEVNEAYAAFHRYPSRQRLLSDWENYQTKLQVFSLDGQEIQPQERAVPSALRGKSASNAELRFYREDTGESWVGSENYAPIRDETGQVMGSIIVERDITEQIQSQAKLIESEEQYRLMFENNPLPVWVYEISTLKFLAANEATIRKYGYSHEELMDMTIRDIRPAEDIPTLEEHLAQTYDRFHPSSIWRHQLKNGDLINVEIVSYNINYNGIPSRLVLANDITERKTAMDALQASEEKFRSLVENIPAVIYLAPVSNSSFQPYVNPYGQLLSGFTTEELINQEAWRRMVLAEDIHLVEEAIQTTLTTGQRSEVEFRVQVGRNQELWMQQTCWAGFAENGDLLFLQGMVTDITSRKNAEQELIHSHELMQYIIEHNKGSIAVHDRDLNYIYVSQKYLKEYQLEGKQVIGKHHYEVIPDLPQKWRDVHQKALRGEVCSAEEDAFIRQDGTVEWTRWECRPWFESNGSIGGIIVYTEMITDRKKAEMALKESNELLTRFINYSPIYAYIKQVEPDESTVIVASENFQDMVGIPGSQMIGKRMEDLFPPEFAEKITREDWAVISKGEILRLDEELNGKNYTTIKFPIDFGERKLLAGYTIDLTDRIAMEKALRESQRRLMTLFSNLPGMAYRCRNDQDWTMEFVSQGCYPLTGYQPDDLIENKRHTYTEIIHPDDRQMVYEKVNAEIATGNSFELTYRIITANGKEKWVWEKGQAVPAEDGSVMLEGFINDVSDRVKAENALRDYNLKLEGVVSERTAELINTQEKLVRNEKLAILGQLAGGVGHELRNPLGVISNAVYFLRLIQPDASEKVNEYLNMIETETHNAEKIISDLLGFARIKSVEKANVKISELVNHTLQRRQAPMNILLELALAEDLPLVEVDPRQVEQVLENLVVNAYQAMPEGGKLSIWGVSVERNQRAFVALHVKDTGIGITSENLSKIFDPLFTTKPKGIGLGLSVCKKLIEANEGDIEVESEPGKGTDFVLFLPSQKN